MPVGVTSDRFRSWACQLYRAAGTVCFDGVGLGLFGIWLGGGIHYNSHLYFKHGADPRRAAILWTVLGYVFFKNLRKTSLLLRAAKQLSLLLSLRWFRWSAYLVCCLGAVQLAIAQTWAMRVTLWDVGIFHQILWSLSHGLGFNSTISGAGDFLSDHFAPSLALLVPLFQFFHESPFFLPVVQVLLLFAGGAAWIYLAEKLKAESALAAATVVFILGFDSLWKNLRWGFHENAIAFCSLSWAMALLLSSAFERRSLLKNAIIGVLFLIAAGSNEIILVDIAVGFVVWAIVDSKKTQIRIRVQSKIFLIFKLFLAFAMVAAFIVFEKMAHPPDKNYFNRYYAYLGGNLNEFLKNLLVAPGLIFTTIGFQPLLRYCGVVFLPWFLLIPAFFKNAEDQAGFRSESKIQFSPSSEVLWLLMIVPSFASAALASFPPLRDPGYHYVLELWPVLACVSIQSIARQKSTPLIWGWALMSLVAMDFDPVSEYREYQSQRSEHVKVIQLMEQIPPESAVMADEFAGVWVSGRKWVTRWPDARLLPSGCPDYVLIEDPSHQRDQEVRDLFIRCEKSSVHGGKTQAGSWVFYRTGAF